MFDWTHPAAPPGLGTPVQRWKFAAEWGLEVSFLPKSGYNLGSTVQVIFYPPERYQ